MKFFSDEIISKFHKRTIESIVDEIYETKTYDAIEQIKSIIPTWIENVVSAYSDDYKVFNKYWNHMCMRYNVSPQKVLLVSYIPIPSELDSFHIVKGAMDILTSYGYNIKIKEHLAICLGCKDKCILKEDIYRNMKRQNVKYIPDVWTPYCSECTIHL